MCFSGDHWEIHDSPLHRLYMDRRVYSMLDMSTVCEKTLSDISALSEVDLHCAAKDVPSCWLAGNDYNALMKLFSSLELRRKRLSCIISRHLEALHLGRDSAIPCSASRIDSAMTCSPNRTRVFCPVSP